MKIFKYQVGLGKQTISWFHNGKPLSFQDQDGALCLWVEVDTTQVQHGMTVLVVGTGHEFDPEGLQYVGTTQQGIFVWHCYVGAP